MPAWIGELRKNIGRGDKKIAVGAKIPENANLIGMSTGSSGGVACRREPYAVPFRR